MSKKKPLHLHKLDGTFQKCRHGGDAPDFNPDTPEPPDILNGVALNEWNRVVPELERLGLLTIFDRAILAQYCILWKQLHDSSPDEPLSAAWHTQFKQIQQELGFTIASRAGLRMPKAEREKPKSKLDGAM